MENMVSIKYYCCENRFVVRVIKDPLSDIESLEVYDSRIDGWIPNVEWYNAMFGDKSMSFKEITVNEAKKYISNAIEYRKKENMSTIYLRLIDGLDLESLNNKTGNWESVDNDEWYHDFKSYSLVSEDDVKQYIKSLFTKKTR